MPIIHPLAVVDSTAQLADDVQVGPFCVVESGVRIGPGCTLASGAIIKSGTTLGANNQLFEGVVLGAAAQHISPPAEMGGLEIGSHNVFREHATVHRALHAGKHTRIGDHNFLMANTHVAHDCVLGNQIISANNVLLGGHVTVGDRVFLSGAVAVHQFCRIGNVAMVGGQAHVTRDIPPFVTVDGLSSYIVGLNLVGLRRADFSAADVLELKAAYRLIYRSGLRWREIVERLSQEFARGPASEFTRFFADGKRGFVQERRVPRAAILKLRRVTDLEEDANSQIETGVQTSVAHRRAG